MGMNGNHLNINMVRDNHQSGLFRKKINEQKSSSWVGPGDGREGEVKVRATQHEKLKSKVFILDNCSPFLCLTLAVTLTHHQVV